MNRLFTYFSFLNWGRGIERMWEIRPVAENKTQESISEDEYSKLQSLKKRNGISLKFYLFPPPSAHPWRHLLLFPKTLTVALAFDTSPPDAEVVGW